MYPGQRAWQRSMLVFGTGVGISYGAMAVGGGQSNGHLGIVFLSGGTCS